MTPAEELRAAAAKLREMAAAADTPGHPWKAKPLFRPLPGCRCLSCEEDKPWAWEIDVVDGPDNEDCFHPMHIGQGDAAWIALMGPQRAEPLAAWLEATAEWIYVESVIAGGAAHAVLAKWQQSALDFARSIMWEAS